MKRMIVMVVVGLMANSFLMFARQGGAIGQEGMMMGSAMGMGSGMGMMGKLQGVIEDLKLTDDQKKDFDKMKFDLMKQLIGQVSKAATARVELQELMHSDKPDKAAIEKKIDELTGQASSIGKLFVGQWFAVNKMLTADQQKVWKRLLEMRPMMNRRMQGMGMMRERMMKMHKEKEDDEKE